MEMLKQKNKNNHNWVVARKTAKINKLEKLVDTLKALGKGKKDIIRALVKSGAKVRQARQIYRDAA